MASSSTNPSTADLVDGTLAAAAGARIVTLTLFPLAMAIHILALTAVALIPPPIPLLLILLAVGWIAAPFPAAPAVVPPSGCSSTSKGETS
jgi:hypothetical protein